MSKIDYAHLLELAKKATDNAYVPYSKFYVGAAILYEDGKIYTGCNVENASYGMTICAERNALTTAIADGQKSKPIVIALACKNTKLCYPCGACRQFIVEFNKNAEIVLEDEHGSPKVLNMSEMMPYVFELES